MAGGLGSKSKGPGVETLMILSPHYGNKLLNVTQASGLLAHRGWLDPMARQGVKMVILPHPKQEV